MAKANGYVLGNIPEDQKFRGQAGLIHNVMSKEEPRTVAEIVAAIEKELQTRQDPTRVVSFYMTVWKRRGWVRPVEVEVAKVVPDQVDQPMNRSDEGLGTTVHEDIAAQLEADVEAAHLEAEEGQDAEPDDEPITAGTDTRKTGGRRDRKHRRR